jgi:hydrogenase nickel incorporation protein HypA/HybF
MHELSIALSVLEVAEEKCASLAPVGGDGKLAVAAIHLKLGPLAGVVKDALLSAFEVAREGSPFPDCELIIEDVPLVARCPKCLTNRPIHSPQERLCPVCGAPCLEIVSGTEMEVTALEVCE